MDRIVSRPERAALQRAEAADRRLIDGRQEAAALRDRIREVTADRDRWRDQAERLADALSRLRAPAPPPQACPAPVSPPTAPAETANDVLYGVPAIAAHMRLKDRQVYHLKAEHCLQTFKVGKTVCARPDDLAAWLATHATGGARG